jgi:hypothetical protein
MIKDQSSIADAMDVLAHFGLLFTDSNNFVSEMSEKSEFDQTRGNSSKRPRVDRDGSEV